MSDASTTPQSGASGEAKTNGVPWQRLFWAAVALAAVYLAFAVATFLRADDQNVTETLWARNMVVLHGIEAIAFTAIGWLFGREVHRGEAQTAKEQAAGAQAVAKAAMVDSAAAHQGHLSALTDVVEAEKKGWRLAEAVRARSAVGAASATADSELESAPTVQARVRDQAWRDLKDLADQLFPGA
jgi:hypothetical protein